ncbi:UNVERIFIED_CONTAM: hypothetical protein FKN15_065243 [Acipenser sinensis]
MAVMLPNNYSKYPWALPRVTPAIHMANEAIQKDDRLLKGYNITVVTESTEDEGSGCSQTLAQINAVDLKLYTNPDVFVGPGCVYSAASVGRFATHWKLPLITAWAPAYGFAKKDEYKTIVRTGPSTTKLGEFANYVHSYFNWTSRAVIIYHDIKTDDRPYYFLIEGIYSILELENITVGAHLYPEPQKIDYKEIVQHIKNSGRIFVITYREPNNQEYLDFQKKLHARAKQDYNVSLEYSLIMHVTGFSALIGRRCERNPCPVDNKACTQAASSISFSYLSLVSNLSVPRVLFRMSAARMHGDSLRFGLLGGRGRGHFSLQRSDRRTGELVLVSRVLGPAVLEAELEMTELEKKTVLARFISKVTVFISQYDF